MPENNIVDLDENSIQSKSDIKITEISGNEQNNGMLAKGMQTFKKAVNVFFEE